jgi:hypothetical protein
MKYAIVEDEFGIASSQITHVQWVLKENYLAAIHLESDVVKAILAKLQIGDWVSSVRHSNRTVPMNLDVLIRIG